MPELIVRHKGASFIVLLAALVAAIAASCLLDLGGGGSKPAGLEARITFEDDPGELPADRLVDDWFRLHWRLDPFSEEEILAQPFRDGGLIFRVARAFDELSGCRRPNCRASSETVFESPVAQLL